MKSLHLLAIVPAAAAFLALPEQERTDGRVQQLAPAETPPELTEPRDRAVAPRFDASEWERGLASESLDERERAYRHMLETARNDPDARRTLREWADDESQVDRAWNARLALRELAISGDPFRGSVDPLGRGPSRLRAPFADPFGGSAFQGGWPDASRLFEDVQRQIEELLQRGGASGAHPWTPGTGAIPPGASGHVQQHGFQLESGPDGVKLRVTELVDGKEEERTYEAESMEELLDAYPELRDRIRTAPGLPGGTRRDLEGLLERMQRSPFGLDGGSPFDGFDGFDPSGGPVPTDRLGILMREPGSYGASVEGVEPGVGLLVERVLPRTIASELGLQQGDILTELNGRALSGAEDVRVALSAREGDEPVVVKLVDAFGQARTVTWDPAATAAEVEVESDDAGAQSGPVPLRRRM